MNEKYNHRKMIFPIITEEVQKLPFYVTGVGMLVNQHPVVRPNGLPCYHFLYITAGKGYLKIKNKEYIITPNMGFYFGSDVPHEYYALEEPWTSWWITFHGYAVKDLIAISKLESHPIFHVYEPDKLTLLHKDIYVSAQNTGLSATAAMSYHLYRFLLELENCIGTDTPSLKKLNNQQLQPVLSYLESHFDHDITLEELADIVTLSPQHLCRLFRQTLHIRPFEYLTKCRLQKAKELLTDTSNPTLKEISSQTGFKDISYFCSVFKRYEGMTPIEFKRINRGY